MYTYKRTDSSVWYYSFRLAGKRYRGPTGIPKTEAKRKANAVAERERDKIREALARTDSGDINLNDACMRYWTEIAQHQPAGDDVLVSLTRLAKRLGKQRLLFKPVDNDLAKYVAKRRGDKTKRGLVSNATVNRDIELLRRVYRRAKEVWKFRVDMPDWKAHKLPEPVERARELSAKEQEALFSNIRPDLLPLVEFAMLSGIRLSNLTRLTWAQVDFREGIRLSVKSKRPGGKTHIVPVTRAMQMLLARQKGHHPIYVFTYECKRNRGKRVKGERYPFSKNGWRKDWKAALMAAKIEDFRFHDLRHTAATRVLRKTGNLRVVQKMLGHSDISATARYAHVTQDDVLSAMEASHGHDSGHDLAGDDQKTAENGEI